MMQRTEKTLWGCMAGAYVRVLRSKKERVQGTKSSWLEVEKEMFVFKNSITNSEILLEIVMQILNICLSVERFKKKPKKTRGGGVEKRGGVQKRSEGVKKRGGRLKKRDGGSKNEVGVYQRCFKFY